MQKILRLKNISKQKMKNSYVIIILYHNFTNIKLYTHFRCKVLGLRMIFKINIKFIIKVQ